MDKDLENVKQAKESFDRILDNKKYAGIIRDDTQLSTLLDLLKGGNYRRILDIGTGTGYLAFSLAEKFPEAEVCGIDIAETIIAKNNETVRQRGIFNLTFLVFDGLAYPFEEESFDLIVSRYAFHHFPDVRDAVSQMNRLLVKGGIILISDPMRNERDADGIIDEFMRVKKDGHIQFYSSMELNDIFVGSGFVKKEQVITEMKFPFAPKEEYVELYEKTSVEGRKLYDIMNENGVVWVKHIEVGNTIFVKG